MIRFRSLRLQLVLWNALTLTALLAVLGFVTRFAAGEAILSSVDQQLTARTQPPHEPKPGGSPGPGGPLGQDKSPNSPPAARDNRFHGSPPPPGEPPPGPDGGLEMRVFNAQGHPRGPGER